VGRDSTFYKCGDCETMKTNQEVIDEYIQQNKQWLDSMEPCERVARIICDTTRADPNGLCRGSAVTFAFEFLYDEIVKALKTAAAIQIAEAYKEGKQKGREESLENKQ
jgi:hypothetical protein